MKNIFELDTFLEELRLPLDSINFNYKEKGNRAIKFWVGNIVAKISNTFKETFKVNLVLELKDYKYDLKKTITDALEKKFSLSQIETIFESSKFLKFEESVSKLVKRIELIISKENWDLFFKCHENYITQTDNTTYNEDNWVNFENGGYIRRYRMRDTKYRFPNIYYLKENPSGIIVFLKSSPLLDIKEKTIDAIMFPFMSIFNNYYYSEEERELYTTNRNNKDNYSLIEFMNEDYKLPEIIFTKDKKLNLTFSEDKFIENYIKYPMISFKTFFGEEYRKTNIDHKDIEEFSNGVITEKDFPKSYHESKKWADVIKQHLKELEDTTVKNENYEPLSAALKLLERDLLITNLKINMLNDDLIIRSEYSLISFKDVFVNDNNEPSYILYQDSKLIDLDDNFQKLIDIYVDFYKSLIEERYKIKEEK